jgi:Domain of unknown function (DUF4345)
MPRANERRLLQATVAVFALIPIGAGLAGVWFGPEMVDSAMSNVSLDSHFRYLSGLLFGAGFAFWSTIPSIERHAPRFRLLTALVFIGGLARLWSLLQIGAPSIPMLGGLTMELIITPMLCLWQARVANAFHGS